MSYCTAENGMQRGLQASQMKFKAEHSKCNFPWNWKPNDCDKFDNIGTVVYNSVCNKGDLSIRKHKK